MVANTFVDPSLGIVMRNSVEFPNLYISKCGQWLYNSARKNFLKKYYRNKKYKYLKCCLCTTYLHRLVALAWVFNPCPGVFNTVDHIDHDTQNNDASNLRWCTVQLNGIHRKTKGFHKIVKRNGAVFYRSRTCIGGESSSRYYRTKEAAVYGTQKTRDDNFARIYKTHLDEWTAKIPNQSIHQRAPFHVLWTDRDEETPEGFEHHDPGTRGYREGRHPQFAFHH